LLSQFLSPLFNKRRDEYGGAIANRMRLLLEAIEATRAAVGPNFPIAVKLNSSDQLEGGLGEEDALQSCVVFDLPSSGAIWWDRATGTQAVARGVGSH
jgi:2,4-dienoyl-CoA reductase-like NADH-dependent reductase (Old Yellow Enzyme family)